MSYALYYAIKYDFLLESVKVGMIMQYGDCILLTMTWLYLMNNKVHNRKKINKLRRYALDLTKSKHDFDTHWLFCFEVLDVDDFMNNSDLWGWSKLKEKEISFIRQEYKNEPPL